MSVCVCGCLALECLHEVVADGVRWRSISMAPVMVKSGRAQRSESVAQPLAARRLRERLARCVVRSRDALSYFSDAAVAPRRNTHSVTAASLAMVAVDTRFAEALHRRGRSIGLTASPLGAPLVALRTDGDGSCLPHAISLSLWGIHDRSAAGGAAAAAAAAAEADGGTSRLEPGALRVAMHECLSSVRGGPAFRERWERHVDERLEAEGVGEVWDAVQRDAEWARLVEDAKSPNKYLSELHVFALAHVVRRPIIVYADPSARHPETGEALGPAFMHGVYLPLIWGKPELCWRSPIVLGYKPQHFAALVPLHDGGICDANLLPVETLFKDAGAAKWKRRLMPVRFAAGNGAQQLSGIDLLRKWADPCRPNEVTAGEATPYARHVETTVPDEPPPFAELLCLRQEVAAKADALIGGLAATSPRKVRKSAAPVTTAAATIPPPTRALVGAAVVTGGAMQPTPLSPPPPRPEMRPDGPPSLI